MNVIKTEIPDVLIFEPKIFADERGFFFESFNLKDIQNAIGRNVEFVQDNHSKSVQGVLRGLHYQLSPYSQGKLVRCTVGEVLDVAVDIRKSSSTFGQWVAVKLSESNKRQLWIPEGFAHGFVVLSDVAEFLYKTTNYYAPEFERTISYNDADLNIDWEINNKDIILSKKDSNANKLSSAELYI